jgi:hypothetical protein
MEEPSDAFVARLQEVLSFLSGHGFDTAAAAVYDQLEGLQPAGQEEGQLPADGAADETAATALQQQEEQGAAEEEPGCGAGEYRSRSADPVLVSR